MEGEPPYVKAGVSPSEHAAHAAALALGLPAPAIISYDAAARTLAMQRIRPDGQSVADLYGDEVPPAVWEAARELVAALLEGGVEYPDITGYNFIEDDAGKLWVRRAAGSASRRRSERRRTSNGGAVAPRLARAPRDAARALPKRR
jgi:tRNA A-37 threonylcarbamoyl transferase component Bud32